MSWQGKPVRHADGRPTTGPQGMSTRIGLSPLTGRIYLGRVNRTGDAFIGDKRDITSDVLRVMIEKGGMWQSPSARLREG